MPDPHLQQRLTVAGRANVPPFHVMDLLAAAQARRTTNDSARVALYRQADQIAFEEAPMIFLWFYNELYALQPWIQNFQVPVIFNGQKMMGGEMEKGLASLKAVAEGSK